MTKIKEHFTLKTMMYNTIMFRKIIFEILTRNISIYVLHTCSAPLCERLHYPKIRHIAVEFCFAWKVVNYVEPRFT